MKEISILSGKGGAGKTGVTAAFASIVKNAVMCDNDVDAADLHILLTPAILESNVYQGAYVAKINNDFCANCGVCFSNCRFDAIQIDNLGHYFINSNKCEGCRLCERVCAHGAITCSKSENSEWYVSNTRFGKMVHARMGPGEENSGKLVTKIRKKAKEIALDTGANYIINDGPPGIGCTAISSITGTDIVVVVIEATQSGLHDVKRLVQLVQIFGCRILGIINKSDISEQLSKEITAFLIKEDIPLIASLPFDNVMVGAITDGQTIIEYQSNNVISIELKRAWEQIEEYCKQIEYEKG